MKTSTFLMGLLAAGSAFAMQSVPETMTVVRYSHAMNPRAGKAGDDPPARRHLPQGFRRHGDTCTLVDTHRSTPLRAVD